MATNIKTMYTSNQITCFPLNDLQRFKRLMKKRKRGCKEGGNFNTSLMGLHIVTTILCIVTIILYIIILYNVITILKNGHIF